MPCHALNHTAGPQLSALGAMGLPLLPCKRKVPQPRRSTTGVRELLKIRLLPGVKC